ncbi:Protein CLEC-53 [Aphelenchoides avenae]|nr:Protein CLEC-53 [Aphelenchus avenae]
MCPAGSVQSPLSDVCYAYVKDAVSWYDAENDCVQRGGHLASSTNAFVNSVLRNMDCGCADDLWLGGSVGLTSSANWSWSDGSRFKYTDWAAGQPSRSAIEQCLQLQTSTGKWASHTCDGQMSYICSVPPNNEPSKNCPSLKACPSGWTYFEETGKCHKLVYNVNYYTGLTVCQSAGGTYASIHNDKANMALATFASTPYVDRDIRFWIGLRDPNEQATPGKFQWGWTDGSPLDYTRWIPDGHPVNNRSWTCACILNQIASVTPQQWAFGWDNYGGCEQTFQGGICQLDPQ